MWCIFIVVFFQTWNTLFYFHLLNRRCTGATADFFETWNTACYFYLLNRRCLGTTGNLFETWNTLFDFGLLDSRRVSTTAVGVRRKSPWCGCDRPTTSETTEFATKRFFHLYKCIKINIINCFISLFACLSKRMVVLCANTLWVLKGPDVDILPERGFKIIIIINKRWPEKYWGRLIDMNLR